MIDVTCPDCGVRQPVAGEKAGKEVFCESCGARFSAVPESGGASAGYDWEGHPLWRNYFWQVVLGVPLIAVFGVGFLILIPCWLRRLSLHYTVTGTHIIARRGIFSVHTVQIAVKDIRSIDIRASLFQRVLGIRQVDISTAGNAGIELSLFGVPRDVAEAVQALQRK